MKALIVAAGTPPTVALLRERAAEADIVIAVDGGLQTFGELGLRPDLVVGDMDSVHKPLLEKMRERGSEIVFAEREKNDTDSWLALMEAKKQGVDEVVLLGATGGRADHMLSNLMLLKWSLENGIVMEMEDEKQIISIGIGNFEISGEIGQTVSLLPVDAWAEVTAEGLYYPLEKLLLKNDRPRGVSNVFQTRCAKIRSKQPVLVVKIKRDGQPM